MTKFQNLVDAVRTLGQLLLHNGISDSCGVYDKNGLELPLKSRNASRFSYFGGQQRICSKFRGRVEFNVFLTLLDECCDKVIGKSILPFMWETADARTRKRWATKLANYTGE